jgi:hypothetical protein
MKLVYTNLYNQQREEVIKQYPCFQRYFADIEDLILKDPYASSEDRILFQDKFIHAENGPSKQRSLAGCLGTNIYTLP